MTQQDIDLQKVHVLESSYQGWFNFRASIVAGGTIAILILITTIKYENIINFDFMLLGDFLVVLFIVYAIKTMRKTHEQHMVFINDLITKIEKGENLPSLIDLRKMANAEPDKEKPKGIWIATIDKVGEKDFEDTRTSLLNSYHSYIQTHAGYIIALIIAFVADAFLKSQLGIIVFGILIIGISIVFIFMVLRVVYWTLWASVAITIPIGKALENFNNREINIENTDYLYKAPNTNIITQAISEQIKFEKDLLPCYKKLALKTAGKSF